MQTKIEVNRPIDAVFALYVDKSRFKEWKRDFVSYKPVSGNADEVGAVTKLVYKNFVMIETITAKKAPSEIDASYEYQQGNKTIMIHTAKNHFTSLAPDKTLITVDADIKQINSFIVKLMMKLMAGAGRKQAQGQLDKFKVMAEKG